MNKLKTMLKKTRVVQSLETDDLNITFTHDQIDGKVPDMVTAKAVPKETEVKWHIDLVYYPGTCNMQITIHNKPEAFKLSLVDEMIEGVTEVLEG